MRFFGCPLDPDVVRAWSSKGGTQVIGQTELAPAAVARLNWPELLGNARVIHFVDNDSARYALIRGSSPCLESAWLVQSSWTDENEIDCRSWIARVPSRSNIADGPSRGDREECNRLFPHIKWLTWSDTREDADAVAWLI